jgi:hypothetical protein
MENAPAGWSGVEWWFCPSYYSEDPLLARMFGAFEKDFLATLASFLPEGVACFWTGPSVVSKAITLAHARKISRVLKHPLIVWDNYPVNDLSMSAELHLAPLTGRDPRLPEVVYGYLNNPMLQPTLSRIALATCFDYANDPVRYRPERSWQRAVQEQFGSASLPHWRTLRRFCQRVAPTAESRVIPSAPKEERALRAAAGYVKRHRHKNWARELRPWRKLWEKYAGDSIRSRNPLPLGD